MNCFTHMKLSNWCIDKTNTINTFTARYIITTLNIKKTICTCCYMWPLFMKQWHKIQCNITYWILRRHPVNTWSVNSQPSGDQLIWIDQKLVDSRLTVNQELMSKECQPRCLWSANWVSIKSWSRVLINTQLWTRLYTWPVLFKHTSLSTVCSFVIIINFILSHTMKIC